VNAADMPTRCPDADRDDVFALVAHELRNPLHALTLQLAVAHASARTPDHALTLRQIDKARATLARYTERVTLLLDLVTLESSAFPLKRKSVDLVEVLQGLVDSLAEEARHRGIALSLQAPPRLVASTDPVLVEQVIENLLLNAFKHAACNEVRLELSAEDDMAVICVADDGRGIAAQDRDRVFGKFGVAAHSQRGQGTGLGLWIVRKLCAALGGSVELDSAPGEGCTFCVRLPVSELSKEST
jgi:signal transduction histidine kinase